MNDWSDRIFDSFLDEIISGETPSDVSDRVLAQWRLRQEQTQNAGIPIPDVPDDEEADRSWWQQVVHVPPIDSSASGQVPVVTASNASYWTTKSNPNLKRVEAQAHSAKRWRQTLALSLGVVACLLAIVSLVSVFPEFYSSENKLAQNQPSNTVPRPTNPPVKIPTTPSVAAKESPANKDVVPLPRPERLDIKGLPFAVVEPDAMPTNPEENQTPNDDIPLSDGEIIAEINSSFATLWQQYKVQPIGTIDDKEWLERTASVLLNTTPTSTQIDLFKQTEDANKRGYLLQQATSSERFSRFFAKQIASLLVAPKRDETSTWRDDFELWLTQNIAQRTPYNEVVYKLLSASPVKPVKDNPTTGRPESYWLSQLRDSHGHQVAQRVSSLWLNQSLQCSQCHNQGDSAETSQTAYWSLVAALNLGDKPEYFFELKDGTLKAAVAALPNGQSIESVPAEGRRAAFAEWLATSPSFAEGTVNMTWRLVFGAPLVSIEAAVEDPTTAQRQKLLQTLAQQFRVHRYDLSRLVLWVTGSQPFAVPSRIITQKDWLLASESELRDIRNAENLFANYRRLELLEDDSREVLQKLVRFEREEAGNKLKRTVLAQPMPTPSLSSPNPINLSDEPLPAWQQNLRLHASPDSDATHQQLIERLLKSKLTWPQLVQHALGHEPSPQELSSADELLQYHGGDKRATLLKLHWTTHLAGSQ